MLHDYIPKAVEAQEESSRGNRLVPNRDDELVEHGTRRARHAPGATIHHVRGILSEFAVAKLFGVPEQVDTELYDCGDPGYDLRIDGCRIDVKTAGPRVNNPRLLVDAAQPVTADCYVLVQELGLCLYRVMGYAPAETVEAARVCEFQAFPDGDEVRVVEQDQLVPLPVFAFVDIGWR